MLRVFTVYYTAMSPNELKWTFAQNLTSNYATTDSLALYSAMVITVPHRIGLIWSCNIDRWWMGCYIRYSEEGIGRDRPPSPLLAVRNVTAHPSTASVPITVLVRCSAVSKWPLKGQSTTVVTYTRYARYNVRWDSILLLFTQWTNQKLLFSRLLR